MIPVTEIRDYAALWQVPEETIERDYSLGRLLWAIGRHENLSRTLVFRGGTCLRKCYVDTHRFSEDLDFSVFDPEAIVLERLRSHVETALHAASDASGLDFALRQPEYREHAAAIHARLFFRGPRATPSPLSVRLDIQLDEPLVRPPVVRTIGHPYSDALPPPAQIYAYPLEELFAEKLRALGDRCRPRDLYDAIYLFRRSDIHAESALVAEILAAKTASKELPPLSIERLTGDECAPALRSDWQHMLGHQLGSLPEFDDYFAELPRLLAWLAGQPLPAETLLPIDADDKWVPPPVDWSPGQQSRLEPVRFAAVNRLCVSLDYQGSTREIEPYSLRLTRDGNVLLFGLRTDNRAVRAYRVDRIRGVSVTRRPFRPVWRIEFAPKGRLSAPPTRSSQGPFRQRRARRARTTSPRAGPKHVFQCTVCGKQFARESYDAAMRPHKAKGSQWPCPGTIGILVRTEW